jgi:very-short-patch-repair endonuclease/DNA polymerase III delta prime subunit
VTTGNEPIARELEAARQRLLDLTLRNRLLNYRPSALRSIRVIGELPVEIYDALVLREKALEFRSTKKPVPATQDDDQWAAQTTLESRHTDRFLETPYDEQSLAKKLFRMYHEGRSAVEEQGYTVAHLAIGFLEWFESDESEVPRRAPLILIPAELERVRAGDFSKVRWTGEDVFANVSLAAKLVEYGVALPPFEAPEEKSGIDAWLQRVVEAIARKPRWRVLSELTLDFFSFTKFVMFKDLDPATWPDALTSGTLASRKPQDHPLLQMLFHPAGDANDRGFDADEIDDKLTARDLWHVMDADPSQIAAIEDVKSGRNLVVQGPPGTGKSQTITNLIAETLAAGRTVLFVSEKMAALEVVKSRLDAAGLGPFCLELHSRKSNKKAVLAELQRSLASKPPAALSESDEHELLRSDLNRYARALGAPLGAWERTPHQFFGMREAALARLGSDPFPPPPQIANAAAIRDVDVAAAENALRELAYILPSVHPVTAHPWRASTRRAMVPQDEAEVRVSLARALDATRAAIDAATALARECGVQEPARLADVSRATRAAEVMADVGQPIEAALLLSSEWNAANPIAVELIARVEAVQRERAVLAQTFRDDALEPSVAAELHEFGLLAAKFLRILSGRYRALRRQLASLYAGTAPKTQAMIADLSRLAEHQSVRDALRGAPRGRGFFGARWLADRSDCAALGRFAEWIVVFRRELLANALTRSAVEIASARVDASAVHSRIDAMSAAAVSCVAALRAMSRELCVEELSEATPFTELVAQIEQRQQQMPALFRWTQFNGARETLRTTAAAALEPYVLNDAIDADRLLAFWRLALAESLLRIAFAERPALGHFIGELHEKKIARFRELDGGLVAILRARLSRRLHASRPQLSGGASPNSEAGILLGEIHRKRGHMAIRKLLTKAGGLIQRIKPCFLMSPLSIAQFLDPRNAAFDLIVFDEASQVRPEDALGAFLRGTQIVVMGDDKQLPPTSFFDHLAADDDANEENESAAMTDVESILHQCARSFPTKTLQWHYRSRHESLIAISNLYFYENQLRIYPSPVADSDALGLHFVHVPRSAYDVGKTRTNRVEAQIVAAAALDHFRRSPDKTLGIGTFNIQQQQAIQEELELQRRAHPEMEPAIAAAREPLFVKNLETIQGDERDTILISLGYGRDASGKLSLNFGPINKEGGERRLNVLISRARERCVVFANFTAQDLVLDTTNAKGLLALKAFLEFAQTRRLTVPDAVVDAVVDEETSAFEDAIASVLEQNGFTVRRRVGYAGFRVDLAIVDPSEPGRYLLGIECDGRKYCEARVARDRDRLRQQMLEQLGWSIHRVWSTDWYRDRAETIARLLQAVEIAQHAPRVQLAPPMVVNVPVVVGEEATVVVPTEDIANYEICRELRIPTNGELHLVAVELLAVAVEDVARVEGPVHVDEVVRRIRTIWRLQRAGNRIREAIERGVAIAIRLQRVTRDGEFLHVPQAPVVVRRRNGEPPARIEWIADAELAEAMQLVLRSEFATPREELIDAAARRVGIQATSSTVASRLSAVIDGEVRRGRLILDGELVRLTRA